MAQCTNRHVQCHAEHQWAWGPAVSSPDRNPSTRPGCCARAGCARCAAVPSLRASVLTVSRKNKSKNPVTSPASPAQPSPAQPSAVVTWDDGESHPGGIIVIRCPVIVSSPEHLHLHLAVTFLPEHRGWYPLHCWLGKHFK